ncbi:hypothetical protein BU17DRAFT_83762 [Hysterangium stoloniferum]|nr:hypothetical protein BU17DRAFT_83762 [Hysterangium stoloniferum]
MAPNSKEPNSDVRSQYPKLHRSHITNGLGSDNATSASSMPAPYFLDQPSIPRPSVWATSTPSSSDNSAGFNPKVPFAINTQPGEGERQLRKDSSATLVSSPTSIVTPKKKSTISRFLSKSATIDEEERSISLNVDITSPADLYSSPPSTASLPKPPKPSIPVWSSRYHSRPRPSRDYQAIPPGPFDVNRGRRRDLPHDWEEHIHPEGQSYYIKTWTEYRNIPVLTEARIYDEKIRARVTSYTERLLFQLTSNKELWPYRGPDIELLVAIGDEDELDDDMSSYYFVHHQDAVIFWLHEVNEDDIEFPHVSGSDHLRLYLHKYYWIHQEYFPSHHHVTEERESEKFIFNMKDVVTCPTSTSSYDQQQLETILNMMNNLKHNRGPARNAAIGRVWAEIYSARFINYHGEPHARLFRTQIEDDSTKPQHPLMKLVFLILFDAPSTHLTTLCEFYSDDVVYTEGWRKCVDHLLKDWQDMILWATVLLTANMSFLAIFNSKEDVISENRAVACSMVSTLSSTTSIVIGLLHVRGLFSFLFPFASKALIISLSIKPFSRLHADEGSEFLKDATHKSLGLQPLAILYSLPYAFLMWAMATFIAAILLFVFQSGVNVTTRVAISSLALALGATLLWVVLFFWRDHLGILDELYRLPRILQPPSPLPFLRRWFTGTSQKGSTGIETRGERATATTAR